jgi:hypothetical protein
MPIERLSVQRTGGNDVLLAPSLSIKLYELTVLMFAMALFRFDALLLAEKAGEPGPWWLFAARELARQLMSFEWMAAWPLLLPLALALWASAVLAAGREVKLERMTGRVVLTRKILFLRFWSRSAAFQEFKQFSVIRAGAGKSRFRLLAEKLGGGALVLAENSDREKLKETARAFQEVLPLPLRFR